MRFSGLFAAVLAVAMAVPAVAGAADYVITIKDHAFSPQDLMIPAGEKVKISVKNIDPTPAEFESSDLNREKAVGGNAEIIIFVGPLDAGTYTYFDDFHHDTTKGTITAK